MGSCAEVDGHCAEAAVSCVRARGWHPARTLLTPAYDPRGRVARERQLAHVRALRLHTSSHRRCSLRSIALTSSSTGAGRMSERAGIALPQCRILTHIGLGVKADLDGGDGLHEALLAAGPHAGEALQQAVVALRRGGGGASSGGRGDL